MKSSIHIANFILIGLALCFVAGCSAGPEAKVTTENGGIQVQSKDVQASLGGGTSVTEAEIRVPFYPGSTEKPNESMRMDGASEKLFSCKRSTSDSPEKVAEFYEGKVKNLKFQKYSTTEATNMLGQAELEGGWKIAISANKKATDQQTEITVSTGMEVKK